MSKNEQEWLEKVILSAAVGIMGAAGTAWLGKKFLKKAVNGFLYRLMVDSYPENLWEFASAARKFGLQTIVETNLRTQKGRMINRPLGSPRKFPNLDSLMFNFAQLQTLPTDEGILPLTEVIIGPEAKRPLILQIPIIIAPMAYGLSLSAKAKTALAKGSALAGTATNTGEGPFLPAERQTAKNLILQYNRGKWSKTAKILRQADAIEIYFGQGATGGVGHFIDDQEVNWLVKKRMGLKLGEKGVVHATFPGIENTDKIVHLVEKLRDITGGVPIGGKIAAGKFIERDLEILVKAGVDFITVAGAEEGTKNSPPILEDDFGLPLLWALCRAANFLEKNNLKDKISLIATGGLATPGAYLKAVALGADAVYIGSIALFAMTHTQVLKALPWEPPPEIVFFKGKYQNKLNIRKGAENLQKYLKACQEEMQEGIRALGKTNIKELNRQDLFALDQLTAEAAGVPLGNREIGD
ncbi:MAG: FMN-binding glutamate synthase family protein [Peptococcaceae bacterium]